MTDTINAAAGNPYLQGNYGPVAEEVTAFDLPVVGEIPAELARRYLRNGPNPMSEVDQGAHHWFIGDGMVVFFGDPGSLGPREDALQCVHMALAMQRRMDELQHLWRDVGCARDFRIRIGINTGYCDVGNFGSEQRMDYTIIGPEVNLAARLEQAAGPGTILLSGKTWALVRDHIKAEPRAPIQAKGFAEPIAVYEVRTEQPAALETA